MLSKTDAIKQDIALISQCLSKMVLQLYRLQEKDKDNICNNRYDANGDSFYILNLCLDSTMFIYEILEFTKIFDNNLYKQVYNRYDDNFLDIVKKIRNNMHLYNKNGSYKNKAESIINEQLKEFDMLQKDLLYFLRSDICKIILLKDKREFFCGTDYFFFHAIKEVKSDDFKGIIIRDYAQKIGELLSFFASSYTSKNFALVENELRITTFNTFFKDIKSENILNISDLDKVTSFRLLLSLTQSSYITILIIEFLNIDNIFKDRKWLYFLTKYVAIKYDEIFDNLENLLSYSNSKIELNRRFTENNFKITELSSRNMASGLRNTIHYNINDLCNGKNCLDSFLLKNKLEINDLYILFNSMIEDLLKIRKVISEIFMEVN